MRVRLALTRPAFLSPRFLMVQGTRDHRIGVRAKPPRPHRSPGKASVPEQIVIASATTTTFRVYLDVRSFCEADGVAHREVVEPVNRRQVRFCIDADVTAIARRVVSMSAQGHTRTIRACPLRVCFTSKLGQSGVPAELPDKGHNQISTRNPRNRRLFKARKTLRALPVWAPTGASTLLERDRERRPVESQLSKRVDTRIV